MLRANIDKLVKVCAFNDKIGNSGGNITAARTTGGGKPIKQKRSTANAVVEEEDDREDTEVKEDGMPT